MPPRFAYWTIIVDGQPTAFRTQYREELLPTFNRLRAKHPTAVMMWFARGRLWNAPEEARGAERRGGRERRGADWRPGGEHRDPRARFDVPRDVKRRRFAAKVRRDRRDAHGPPSGGGAERGPATGKSPETPGERDTRPRGKAGAERHRPASAPAWRPSERRYPQRPDRQGRPQQGGSGAERQRDRWKGREQRPKGRGPGTAGPDAKGPGPRGRGGLRRDDRKGRKPRGGGSS